MDFLLRSMFGRRRFAVGSSFPEPTSAKKYRYFFGPDVERGRTSGL
ncbi:hypothetical protein [Paracoccus thiocyanatus]|nr:hypothetical protein [Paracoccus thiocyanatus]